MRSHKISTSHQSLNNKFNNPTCSFHWNYYSMRKLKQQPIPIAPELQLAILMEVTCILVWIQPPPPPSFPATRPLLLKIPFNQRHYWHSLFSLGISNAMYMQSMEPLGHEHVVHKMCVLMLIQKLKSSYLFFFSSKP